jgi:hypothetical protein
MSKRMEVEWLSALNRVEAAAKADRVAREAAGTARAALRDAVHDAVAAGAPVSRVAQLAGVTRRTAYQWGTESDE